MEQFVTINENKIIYKDEPKVENKEKLKTDTNCLIIANHSSHMDVFLMLITCKKPFVFVGKKELYFFNTEKHNHFRVVLFFWKTFLTSQRHVEMLLQR